MRVVSESSAHQEVADKVVEGVKNVFTILHDIDIDEISRRKKKARGEINLAFKMQLIGIIMLAISLVLLIGWWFIRSEWLRYAAEIFLVLGYLVFILATLFFVVTSVPFLMELTRRPLEILFRNMQPSIEADLRFLPALMNCSSSDVENSLVQVKAEREFFERRVGLFVGAIDKVGIIPALLALTTVVKNISQWTWLTTFVYAVPFLYMFGIYCQFVIMRLDRKAKLLELVINRKESEATRSQGRIRQLVRPMGKAIPTKVLVAVAAWHGFHALLRRRDCR